MFDALDRLWRNAWAHRTLGIVLVIAFLGALAAIGLNRVGALPAPLAARVSTNPFAALHIAFTLLLIVEVLALVFALASSVASALGKQFELLSLILLRDAFLEFGKFTHPIDWSGGMNEVMAILADMAGAMAIFVLIGYYNRIQRHRPLTADEREQASFVAAKKFVALLLLAAFVILALARTTRTSAPLNQDFFAVFFTVLIFSDVLLVLISLSFSSSYHVVFRNAGFAAATLVIRLALTAPAYVNVMLGLGAALFALALSFAYNVFAAPVAGAEVQDRRDQIARPD